MMRGTSGTPRHTKRSRYRCSLPGLAGFAGLRRTEPEVPRIGSRFTRKRLQTQSSTATRAKKENHASSQTDPVVRSVIGSLNVGRAPFRIWLKVRNSLSVTASAATLLVLNQTGFTGCEKSALCCHSERSEESLFDSSIRKNKERFFAPLRMTRFLVFPQPV